jgi:hypothetical protein
MRTIRSINGRLTERPHFQLREIDQICASELQKVSLYPSAPEPIRIDRFIEKRFHVTPDYEMLPDGVLGFTRFGKSGVEAIVVARSLDDGSSKVVERRLRSTLAHEAGHGLLHSYLFALGEKPKSLFDDHDHAPRILCREVIDGRDVKLRSNSHWSEFQANRAIGGLLMPRPLIERAIEKFFVEAGTFGVRRVVPDKRDAAIRSLSDTFDVNPIVARLRLDDLFPPKDDAQLSL